MQTPTCLGGTITWDASLFPVLWEVWTFSYPCHRRFKVLKSLQPLTGKYISWDIWCSKTDSRSSVPRNAATPPSWSQHCSSKAGVSFQDLLGCGTWRMQSVCSNFNFVWFLSSCWKSEYGPDFLQGGSGVRKGTAAHICIAFLLCHSQLPESVPHLSHQISLTL